MDRESTVATITAADTRRVPAATWLVPPLCALGIACGVTVVLITVFNYVAAPISRDLGLSLAETATALSIHLATLIVALPVAGALADRFGARAVLVASALAFGASLFAISQVESGRLALYAAFALAGAAGAGASPVTYARAIVHRFDARRGLALGIALAGTGLGGALLPALFRPVLVEYDWRIALQCLAVVVSAVGVVAGLLLGRERVTACRAHAEGWTLRAATGHPVFWVMTMAFALLGLALAALVAHLSTIWSALGLATDTVPRFQAIMGIATIVGRLLGGALMDRLPAQFVGAGAAVVGAAGLALLASGGTSAPALALVAVAIGVCTGTESDVISYLSSRFFGLRHFARIYAVQGSLFMVGFSVGPLAAAHGFGTIGVPGVLAACAALLLASATTLALLRAPAR